MSVPSRLADRLLHLLLPAACLGCGEVLPARPAALGLCTACRGRLARHPASACAGCGRPLASTAAVGGAGAGEAVAAAARLLSPAGVQTSHSRVAPQGVGADAAVGQRCGACRRQPSACDELLVPWVYQPPLDAVLRSFKFGRLDYLGAHLARSAGELLGRRLAGCDAVVPVPLHWRRRLARGYNQAERIARPLARQLDLPLVPALVRRRATAPQSGLPRRARLANARRAFRARRSVGPTALLVDDVVTTGATLAAAAEALKAAGCARVVALAMARTPEL